MGSLDGLGRRGIVRVLGGWGFGGGVMGYGRIVRYGCRRDKTCTDDDGICMSGYVGRW